MHTTDGKFIPHNLYYVRQHEKPRKLINLRQQDNAKIIKLFNRSYIKLKSKHGLANAAWENLMIYCRALDLPGYHQAFTRLWAVMESLSGIQPSESHDKIVSRNAFLYTDPEHVKLMLHHLRTTRNKLVHSDMEITSESEELVIYQLNRFVCHLLNEYIYNAGKFMTVSDFISFLDHPLDANVLRSRLNVLQKAYDHRKDI